MLNEYLWDVLRFNNSIYMYMYMHTTAKLSIFGDLEIEKVGGCGNLTIV